VKFCPFFLVRRQLPFFGQNCSLPFSLRSLDIPALLKSWQKHYYNKASTHIRNYRQYTVLYSIEQIFLGGKFSQAYSRQPHSTVMQCIVAVLKWLSHYVNIKLKSNSPLFLNFCPGWSLKMHEDEHWWICSIGAQNGGPVRKLGHLKWRLGWKYQTQATAWAKIDGYLVSGLEKLGSRMPTAVQ
jgi:hypothetical protein